MGLFKKGDIEMDYADRAPFYIVFMIIFSFVIIGTLFIFQIRSSSIATIHKGVETYILSQRFISSPYCFAPKAAYAERTFFAIPINSFNEENLNACYLAGDLSKKPALELSLTGPLNQPIAPIHTLNWDAAKRVGRRTSHHTIITNGGIYLGKLSIAIQNE